MAYSPASLIEMLAQTAKLNTLYSNTTITAVIQEDSSGASFTDETTDANDDGADDVAMPDPFDTDDALYFGSANGFAEIVINVGTAGVGDDVSGETVWEYYDGVTWTALNTDELSDGTSGFTVAGVNSVSFDPPIGWSTTTINSQGPYKYVRLRATADDVFNTTQPTLTRVVSVAPSAERHLALEWLQEAADLVCASLGLQVPAQATVTLTEGQSEYALDASPFPTDMLSISNVMLTDTAVTGHPVEQVQMDVLDGRHSGSQANSTPYEYAVDWPRFRLYPSPGASSSLLVRYVQDGAPMLVDNNTPITWLPKHLQKGCLYPYAMARAMEYKKDFESADRWDAKFLNDRQGGLPAAKRWKATTGGRQGPTMGGRLQLAVNPSQDLGGL